MIDLGLPSGTKWACCNVGADKPEALGDFYAWGETEEKSSYNWNSYIYCDGSYSTCHDLGYDISGTQNDVAHVKWGGSWVMPSLDQIKELRDYCTYEWTTINGVKSAKFSNKANGSEIILPAAGYRNDSVLLNAGSYGGYWSSTQDPSDSYMAKSMYFNASGTTLYYDSRSRSNGRSVRPVSRN